MGAHALQADERRQGRCLGALSEFDLRALLAALHEHEGPEPTIAAVRERLGTRPMTLVEFEAFMAEHGPHMLAPDGEG